MNNKILTYSELITLPTFEERFRYLKIDNQRVGVETFGGERWINQEFYRDPEWKALRRTVILRDNACDLAVPGYIIDPDIHLAPGQKSEKKLRSRYIYVHHLNPITVEDVINHSKYAWDPEYLVCTSLATHNAIHFDNITLSNTVIVERTPNDLCPWKIGG